jgi:hypothetical protein
VDNKLYKKSGSDCPRKKEVHFFLGATGIRRAGEKVVLYLLDGLYEMWRRLPWDEGIRRSLKEGAFCLLQGVAYDSSPKEPELDTLMTPSP